MTSAILNVLHIQFPPQGEAPRGRRLCRHLPLDLRVFGRGECLVHGGRALGHGHGSGCIEPGSFGFGGVVCHLPPFHLRWLHRFVPRLRRGGKPVTSWWMGAAFVGERAWFLELSAEEAKPETPTLLEIFRDLPRVKL